MDVRKKIENKGLKKKWLAEQIGISTPMFSLYLSGERSLSKDKEDKLFELLS